MSVVVPGGSPGVVPVPMGPVGMPRVWGVAMGYWYVPARVSRYPPERICVVHLPLTLMELGTTTGFRLDTRYLSLT